MTTGRLFVLPYTGTSAWQRVPARRHRQNDSVARRARTVAVDARQTMAAIIVASLLWLPSDAGRICAVDARPAAATTTTTTTTPTTVTTDNTTTTITVTIASVDAAVSPATSKTSAAATAQFSVHMILPFSKSTIRYSYTEPSASATSARTPVQTTDVDQAHSMGVSPYGCGTTADGDVGGARGRRKRKRVRWKTTTAAAAQTNTVMPLPGYPTTDRGRGVVFEAAAEQLDRLYTVSRVDGAVSSTGDGGEASDEGGTTDPVENGTAAK